MKTDPNAPINTIFNQDGFLSYVGNDPAIGLTKREYFAAMAMQGLCANSLYIKIAAEKGQNVNINWTEILTEEAAAISNSIIDQLNATTK